MPRRKPFSNKQKKLQLQEKRKRKNEAKFYDDGSNDEIENEGDTREEFRGHMVKVKQINQQPEEIPDRKLNPNRYRLHFFKESKTEIERRKHEARRMLSKKNEEDLEIDFEEVYQPGSVLDIPVRPPWNYTMSKQKLEASEEKYFQEYLDSIFDNYTTEGLSYFEMNLETWRQLWRVLEMSDVILLIVDIRYPVLHFSPVLYSYVTEKLRKHVIVVLNKIDLVSASVVTAWKHYLLEKYPYLKFVLFTSFPEEFLQGAENEQQAKAKKKRKKGGRFTRASGARELLRVCEDIVGDKVDLRSWEEKLDMDGAWSEGEEEEREEEEEKDTAPKEQEMFKDGVLTLGCVGYPNVGKSSVLNGLVGKKVVSVSRTPGHTKHFQTIYLTSTVKLCDCPGLVFPSLINKSLQILAGIYPIAQVQEPYTPVGYIGERIDIPHILHLQHPSGDTEWSAYDICEAWAKKRGFITAKASRPDVYRAANNLLRMSLDGRLCLSLKPKGFTAQKSMWEKHQDTLKLLSDLEQFKPLEDSDSGDESFEDTDEDLNDAEIFYKDEKFDEDSDEDETAGFSTKNPFSLLMDD